MLSILSYYKSISISVSSISNKKNFNTVFHSEKTTATISPSTTDPPSTHFDKCRKGQLHHFPVSTINRLSGTTLTQTCSYTGFDHMDPLHSQLDIGLCFYWLERVCVAVPNMWQTHKKNSSLVVEIKFWYHFTIVKKNS